MTFSIWGKVGKFAVEFISVFGRFFSTSTEVFMQKNQNIFKIGEVRDLTNKKYFSKKSGFILLKGISNKIKGQKLNWWLLGVLFLSNCSRNLAQVLATLGQPSGGQVQDHRKSSTPDVLQFWYPKILVGFWEERNKLRIGMYWNLCLAF